MDKIKNTKNIKDKKNLFLIEILAVVILVLIITYMVINIKKQNNQELGIKTYNATKVYGVENNIKNTIDASLADNINSNENDINEEVRIVESQENNVKENIVKSNDETNLIPATYGGNKVIAKLNIPKINLETYVLSEYSKQSLLVSVTKFWGGEPNEVGNFCIAGHNYVSNNMFHNLNEVVKEDKIFLTDTTNRKVQYKVYSVYKVKPDETKCVSQQTNGKKEITLITCTVDSSLRIIVKAEEVK